jgi:galactose oxidase
MAIDAVSLIRYSAATHALNNDLRRIPLKPTVVGGGSANTYSFVIPGEPGVTLPGYWMLFVLNNKIPSEARTVQITLNGKEKA